MGWLSRNKIELSGEGESANLHLHCHEESNRLHEILAKFDFLNKKGGMHSG